MNAASARATPSARLEPAAGREWQTLARIMTASAACAGASGLLSAIATKVIAALAGPAAIGLLATLQQIGKTALVAATANGKTALVQGASARLGAERREYVCTVSAVFAAATACVAAVLWFAPAQVARWGGLDAAGAPLVRWLSVSLAFSSLFVFLGGLLNALGAAGAFGPAGRLALLQMAGPGALAVLAWPMARRAGESPGAYPAMLAIAAAVTVIAAAIALIPYWSTLADWFLGPGRWGEAGMWLGTARHFFSISAVMLASGLAASAALMAVRARIIRVQGLAEAGQFDAAWGISMNQVSLVLASLQTHYLPMLARLGNVRDRSAQIARVIALAAPAAALVIAALAAAKPFWLTALYSAQFHGAGRYLRWTLAGDYLKVTSWILSIPILAAAEMRVFLAADLAASGAFVASASMLTRFYTPAEAAAVAFLLMHAVYLTICGIYLQRRHGFHLQETLSAEGGTPRLGRVAAVAWTFGLALVAGVSIWNWNA